MVVAGSTVLECGQGVLLIRSVVRRCDMGHHMPRGHTCLYRQFPSGNICEQKKTPSFDSSYAFVVNA